MEKTEIMLDVYQTTPKTALPPLGKAITKTSAKTFAKARGMPYRRLLRLLSIWCMVFLWSRGTVLHILHPLSMGILSVFFGKSSFYIALSAAFLGGLGNGVTLKHIATLTAALCLHLTVSSFAKESLRRALLGAFAMLLGGIFYAVGRGGLRFDFAVVFIETLLVLGLSLLLQKGVSVLFARTRTTIWTREETLSALLVLGGMLAGAANIHFPFLEGRLFAYLTALFLLVAAWREGAGGGAAAGVMIGFLLYVCDTADLTLFVLLSLGGLLSGCFKEIGRIAAASSLFLTAALLLFYMESESMDIRFLLWLGMGCITFILLPKRILNGAGGFWQSATLQDHYIRLQKHTAEKLERASTAFDVLSKSFVIEPQTKQEDLALLVSQSADQVCKGCSMTHYCWTEEVYRTYSMTFSLFSICDAKGSLTQKDLPEWFQDICPRKASYAQTVNIRYQQHRHDGIWTSRLQECRQLVGQQLSEVGKILKELTQELTNESTILEEEEKALLSALRHTGIAIHRVEVIQEQRGLCAILYLKDCNGRGVCRENILPLVQKTLGRTMLQQDVGHCCLADGMCRLTFIEEPIYAVSTATAHRASDTVCGDAAAYIESEKGLALLALSDGMGVGSCAAAESKTAIELLEEFAQAGFSGELAIRLINSALLLRRAEESYATLDICTIDLYSAQAEWMKLGAVASYICRQNRVIAVYTHSLPAGILQKIPIVKNNMRLWDEDMLLMMTDGITDAFGGEQQTAIWLEECFLPHHFANPQDAADFIVKQAKQRSGAQADDMTVQAARFWKKRSVTQKT